jgi:hypothetical protein
MIIHHSTSCKIKQSDIPGLIPCRGSIPAGMRCRVSSIYIYIYTFYTGRIIPSEKFFGRNFPKSRKWGWY